ncbi:MAG: tetratricopeptide repeat protein, partial [Acidobacteriota bacterium]
MGLRPADAVAALQRALKEASRQGDPSIRARLIRKCALMKTLMGRHDEARRMAARASALYRQTRDLAGEADCENIMGISFARVADHVQAQVHYRQALDLRRQGGDSHHLWPGLQNLGMVLFFMGRWKEGRDLLQEALQIAQTENDPGAVSLIINNLGLLAREEGRLEEAERLLKEAEKTHREHGSLPRRGESLLILAEVNLRRGSFDEAVKLAEEAAELYSRLGMHSKMAHSQEILGAAFRESGQIEPALENHERGLSLARRDHDMVQQGFALCSLALDHLAAGDEPAARARLAPCPALAEAPDGSRLNRRIGQARALSALVIGRPDQTLEEIGKLSASGKEGWSFHEDLEIQILEARALLTRGDIPAALSRLEKLLARERLASSLPRHWEVLRLLAQCHAGLGKAQGAATFRRQAIQVFNRNLSLLSPSFRQALERLPAAVRLRIDSGGSATARISPVRFLDTMYSVLEVLTAASQTDRMLEEVTDLAIDLLGAERGMVLLFPEDGSPPQVKVSRGLEDQTIADAISY